jgi:succinate dehydrogenase / fumarate reductase cytochrome b subunit
MIKSRPRYLNLLKIHLPVTGIVSILHRISGILLFCFIPIFIGTLKYSLFSEITFKNIQYFIYKPFITLLLFVFILILMQHFFAGLRFLLMDLDCAMDKVSSQKTAKISLLLSVLSTFAIMWGIYA